MDHIHILFDHTRTWRASPDEAWGIRWMPGPPPRQHEQEGRYGLILLLQTVIISIITGIIGQSFWFSYVGLLFLIFLTTVTHPFFLTRQIWKDDYDGQMIFVGPCGPKAFWHLSYRWGKTPKKTSLPGNLSRPGIEHGTAAWQAHMPSPGSQRWTDLAQSFT